MRKKIAVFFGGRSVEHDISVITGIQALNALNPDKYEAFPVYMKDGVFYTGGALSDINFYCDFQPKKCMRLCLFKGVFYAVNKRFLKKCFRPDAALLCCHGGEGENGALQGFLECNDIPYTSSGIAPSAIGMDKFLSKELFLNLYLNAVEALLIYRDDFSENADEVILHISTFMDYPMIVKPCSAGSSIGINRARNREELENAIEIASAFDRKIVVERALDDFIELNCAVCGNGKTVFVSDVEKPVSRGDFLSFDEKYMSGGVKGMADSARELPAKIDEETTERVKSSALKIYEEFGLSGVARFDFLLSGGKLYINEINTIPGSLAYYLFESRGIGFSELLDIIIDGAFYKHRQKKQSVGEFASGVLKNFGGANCIRLQK